MRRCNRSCRRYRGNSRWCFAPLIAICFGAGLFLSLFCSLRMIIFFSGICLICLGFYVSR
ncbi:MAG: hypothetical protein RR710_00220 [Oscillospiraceae bacterium]